MSPAQLIMSPGTLPIAPYLSHVSSGWVLFRPHRMGVRWNGSRSLQPPPLSFTYSFASYSWNNCDPNFILTDNAHSDVNAIRRSFSHLYNCWLSDCIRFELITTLASSVSIRDGPRRTGRDGAELVYSKTKRTDKYMILGDLGGSSTTLLILITL